MKELCLNTYGLMLPRLRDNATDATVVGVKDRIQSIWMRKKSKRGEGRAAKIYRNGGSSCGTSFSRGRWNWREHLQFLRERLRFTKTAVALVV